MDAYEATKVVFSRIQALDPDHAAKIMGLLLIQDHGDKEMIRLAFGPEALLQSVMAQARKELSLLPASSPTVAGQSPFLLARQNSGRGAAPSPSPLSASSPSSWAQAQPFSRSNGAADDVVGAREELISPANSGGGAAANAPPFFPRGGDALLDDFQLQEQLAFLNDGGVNPGHPLPPFDGAECRSPGPGESSGMFPYSLGWANGGPGHRRSASVNELCLGGGGSDGFGWKPCLYYARGFCKNGSSCRFVHGDDVAALTGATMDAATAEQQQCQDFLLRSKSQRLGPAAFPFSPTGSLPCSPSAASKCLSLLLQQQHNDNQRAAAAALMLGGSDEAQKFMGRPRLDRVDFASMMNPGSRQIYLTFPADSTFREEDVSNYFSIYGPVHDVRIPYQQKRMFGFVTFVYPETVKLILAKGNPHFICDARVLVKPYKEKGKVPDKYRKHQGDFSGCATPTGLDARDPFDLHQLGARMLQHSNSANELMLRRKLEEQQQAAELQQSIELHSRRIMDLQLLDLKSRAAAAATTAMVMTAPTANAFVSTQPAATSVVESPPDSGEQLKGTGYFTEERKMVNGGGDKEESAGEGSLNADSDQSLEHNLPDSPFASPTRTSASAHQSFTNTDTGVVPTSSCSASHVGVNTGPNAGGGINHLRPSTLDIPSPRDFFSVSRRLASDHGAIGM
ncbi:zinc finger CCCH domain-containing protein 22 isoform X1 [Oryza brachyantha]|uniref:C3H1-type domain-containing protein n=1 Tax=Oryza brachyantha TaxID=4533 RepID=J3LNE7_ORYBR|nr:zinc finger CCCH domain-containing protein 22 isoform X1 [Oryza brachyantha]